MIDAIGPFFSDYQRRKINWSKLPFEHLSTVETQRSAQFAQIRQDMQVFATRVSTIGYNAATVDDVVHLVDHPWYESHIREKIKVYAEEFDELFSILTASDLAIYVTMDVLSSTPALDRQLEQTGTNVDDFLADF